MGVHLLSYFSSILLFLSYQIVSSNAFTCVQCEYCIDEDFCRQTPGSNVDCRFSPKNAELNTTQCELPDACYFLQLKVNDELVAMWRGCSANDTSELVPQLTTFGLSDGCQQLVDTEEAGSMPPFYSASGQYVEDMCVCYNFCDSDNCNQLNESSKLASCLSLVFIALLTYFFKCF